MWLLTLTACWRPDPDLAPELPPLEAGVGAAGEGAAENGGSEPADSGENSGENGGANSSGGLEDATASEPMFVVYPAYTAGAPVTLVDDYGKTLCILSAVGSPVEVRGEEENVRKKVWSDRCVPAVEGWVQTQMVTAPGQLPPAATPESLPGILAPEAAGAAELGPSGR